MVMGLFSRSDYGAASGGLVPLSRQENWGKSITRSAISVARCLGSPMPLGHALEFRRWAAVENVVYGSPGLFDRRIF